MTATAPETTENQTDADYVDVVIVGAGFSGIGAAYRIHERNPGTELRHPRAPRPDRRHLGPVPLPGRAPDSSIFTLCFPWEPWTREEGVADGDDIREYMTATARKHGIDTPHPLRQPWCAPRTGTRPPTPGRCRSSRTVTARPTAAGSCSSAAATTVRRGLHPRLPGTGNLRRHRGAPAVLARGPRLHRQEGGGDRQRRHGDHPGAGGVRHAEKVTMLQRSPTYVAKGARISPSTELVRKVLPRRMSHGYAKWRNALQEGAVWFVSRKRPKLMRSLLRRGAMTKPSRRLSPSTCTSNRATTRGISASAWTPTATCSRRSAPVASTW